MFNNPQQGNEKQGPNPLDRSRLQGCSSGTLIWIMLGIALLLWVWNPFGGNGDATQISYSAFHIEKLDQHAGPVTRASVTD